MTPTKAPYLACDANAVAKGCHLGQGCIQDVRRETLRGQSPRRGQGLNGKRNGAKSAGRARQRKGRARNREPRSHQGVGGRSQKKMGGAKTNEKRGVSALDRHCVPMQAPLKQATSVWPRNQIKTCRVLQAGWPTPATAGVSDGFEGHPPRGRHHAT